MEEIRNCQMAALRGTGLSELLADYKHGPFRELQAPFKAILRQNAEDLMEELARRLRHDELHEFEMDVLHHMLDSLKKPENYVPMLLTSFAANMSVKKVGLYVGSDDLAARKSYRSYLPWYAADCLRAHRSVSSLCLRFPASVSLDPDLVRTLAAAVAEKPSLVSLQLRLSRKAISPFALAIEKNTNLQHISIEGDISRSNASVQQDYLQLLRGISCNPGLLSLSISAAGQSFEAPELQLGQEFEQVRRAPGLSADEVHCHLDEAFVLALSKLQGLRRLQWFLCPSSIDVLNTVKAHPSLEDVAIRLDVTLVAHMGTLGQNEKLQSLEVYIEDGEGLGPDGFIEEGPGLFKWSHMLSIAELIRDSTLTEFTLHLEERIDPDRPSDAATNEARATFEQSLATAIGQNTSLRRLTLNLDSSSRELTRYIALAVAKGLSTNNSLQSFGTRGLVKAVETDPHLRPEIVETMVQSLTTNISLLELRLHEESSLWGCIRRGHIPVGVHPEVVEILQGEYFPASVQSMLQRNSEMPTAARAWWLIALIAQHGFSHTLRLLVDAMGPLGFCQHIFAFLLPRDLAAAIRARQALFDQVAKKQYAVRLPEEVPISSSTAGFRQSGEEQENNMVDSSPDAETFESPLVEKDLADIELQELQQVIDESMSEANSRENADIAEALVRSKVNTPSMLAVTVFEVTCHARSPDLTRVLTESPRLAPCRALVAEAGCQLQPSWANGAWVLVPASEHQLDEAGIKLTHTRILARSCDMDIINEELKAFPRKGRPRFQAGWIAAEVHEAAHTMMDTGGTTQDCVQLVSDLDETPTGQTSLAIIQNTFLTFYSVEAGGDTQDSATVHSEPCGLPGQRQPPNPRSSRQP